MHTVNRVIYRLIRLRDHGWLLPRFRHALPPPLTGALWVGEVRDDASRRTVRVAKFLDPATGAPVQGVPPLHDAVLLHASCGRMSISGVEQVVEDGDRTISYAQTWILTDVRAQDA